MNSAHTVTDNQITLRGRWRYALRLSRLLCRIGPREVSLSGGMALVCGLFPVAQLILLRRLVDSAVGVIGNTRPFGEAAIWLGALVATYVVGDVFSWVSRWAGENIQERLRAGMQEQLLLKAGKMPLGSFEQPAYYDRLHRAQKCVEGRVFSAFNALFLLPTQLVTLIGLLAYIGAGYPLFPLILLLGTTGAAVARVRLLRRQYLQERAQTAEERTLSYLEETMRSRAAAAEIRLFGPQDYFLDKRRELFQSLRDKRLERAREQWRVESLSNGGQSLTFGLVLAGIVALVARGRLSLGQYVAYVAAVENFQTTLTQLFWTITIVDHEMQYIGDLFEYLDLDKSMEKEHPRESEKIFASPLPTVEFREVGFRYPGTDHWALRGINLTLHPGERLALVGENGAGKSTLAKLLLGLYEPTEGQILVDGKELREIDPPLWRSQCAAVFQDYVKYQVTARENIAFGDARQLDDTEAIHAAARRSGAEAVVQSLPAGYDTLLGKAYEEGQDLSVGQWQRLALARAYRREASLLVLDEPTAALDARAEVEIYRCFQEAAEGRSALLISHRLGSARLADRIVVLQNGCIVEQGAHEALMAQSGPYVQMLGLQAQWYV